MDPANVSPQRSPKLLILLSTLLAVFIGMMDYLTGVEISFSIFYLIPVSIISWYLGWVEGLFASILAALLWLFVDRYSGKIYSHPAIPYWNGLVRFGFFVIISRVLAQRKRADARAALFVRELETNNRRISILSETGDLLQACEQESEAYTILRSAIPRIFPQSSGSICSLNASRDRMETEVDWGTFQGDPTPSPEDCWSLRNGKMHFIQDLRQEVKCRHLAEFDSGASLCIPMFAHGETIGFVNLRSASLDEGDSRVCTAIADQAALALSNLRLRESLRNQAIRDPLTDLFNRRYMEETLSREIRRAVRTNSPIGLILMDIDHFKRFNDTFGHTAGDALLKEFGILLRAYVRGGDVASRFGGEEFLVILPEASLEEAEVRAQELREATKRLIVTHQGQSLGNITLSLGVASFPKHGSSIEGLLQAADAALYIAKKEGRDRVIVTSR